MPLIAFSSPTPTAAPAAPIVPAPAPAAPQVTVDTTTLPPPLAPEHRTMRAALVNRIAVDLQAQAGAAVAAELHPKQGSLGSGMLPDVPELRAEIDRRVRDFLAAARPQLSDAIAQQVMNEVSDELFGLGPIQPLLADANVTEIMVNRYDRVYAERAGRSGLTNCLFDDDAHVRRIIDRIVIPIGRRIDERTPLVDARLPDGSRVNAVIPPVAIDGPSLTIRKFGNKRLTVENLVKYGSMTQPVADLLRACVAARLNIVVSGGTGSGKTTLLNILSGFIPTHERIVTIEDAAELKLEQDQVVRMETKRPDLDGGGGVDIRDLVRNALRMRPDRIVVGECRGGEALDMLQAMNTGHDGSLTTLHANTPRDAISRMETLALMGGIDFPVKVVREQIASAVQLIVQQARLRDGTRRVTHVTEMAGMEGERVVLQEIFRWNEEGTDANGKVIGSLRASGLRPTFLAKLESHGFKLPGEMFIAAPGQAGGMFGRR